MKIEIEWELLDRLLDVAERCAPSPGHAGACGQDTNCDGGCVDAANLANLLAAVRERAAAAITLGEVKPPEPQIVINGHLLEDGQAATVRCAVENFATYIAGNDEVGEIGHAYLDRIVELRRMMYG